MKILVTGANGMLAKEVKEKFTKGNEIIATDVSELDITNEKAVMEYVENTLPNTPIKIDNNPINAKNIHSICNCTIDGRMSELNA